MTSLRLWILSLTTLWFVLTASACMLRVRHDRAAHSSQPAEYGRHRIIANNLLDTLAAPGLGVAYALRAPRLLTSRAGTALVYGIGFTFPIGAVILLACLRHQCRRLAHHERIERLIDPSRRRLLVDGSTACAGLLIASAPIYGSVIEPNSIAVRRYRVGIQGLPRSLDGLRLVQLSDTHLGPRVHESLIIRAVNIALEQKPDLVILTGDYVHDGASSIDRAAELFRPLIESNTIQGVVGVLGNHDWYADGPRVRSALSNIGVHMIDNAHVHFCASSRSIKDSSPIMHGDALCFAGLGDLLTDTVRPDQAFDAVHLETPRILLAHVPDTLELQTIRAPNGPRIDLALCGHTHGGQIRLPFLGTPGVPGRYGQRYAGGLIDPAITGPRCPVIVSRGIGTSILPVRIGVPPEVVVIELHC